jgi:hypothetical protein
MITLGGTTLPTSQLTGDKRVEMAELRTEGGAVFQASTACLVASM